MPGKQDPDYFPLNLNNMNGGLGFYGEVSPILIPHRHHGKFDTNSIVHNGSPIAMALHNSPVNATIMSDNLMSEYINMNVNGLQPVNSEDEEEDDIVSQSGSESVSVQGSDLDLDVEVMDDVDSLVLNIRDKLRMAPQFNIHHGSHSAGEFCWTDSPSATSTPNSIHSTTSNNDNDLLILPQQRSSSTANNSSKSNVGSSHQRKRRGTFSRSSNSTLHWRHSHPNSNNSYYRQFNQSGSITKSKKTSSYQNHWWSSRSFSDLSKQSRSKDAYHLLQELIQSGTLIQEAVRRLNRKCLNSSNNGSSSNNSNNPEPITPSNSNASLVVSSSKFSYMDEDAENNYTSHHQHHSLQRSAPCN